MKELTSSVLERVAGIISRYSMIARGSRVGVAVSGGADSVCLLHVLRELAPSLEIELSVLHLNHRLRGLESDRDQEFVRALACSLRLPFHTKAVDVATIPGNMEQAGREARSAFFQEIMASGLDRVATGHTQSDQAETVLFRFLRGSGAAGLSGILPITQGGLIRPLLDCQRTEIEAFLTERSLAWREDASNLDIVLARNRIRHQLLPQLQAEYNPALTRTLAQMAALANDEEAYWSAHIQELSQRLFLYRPPAILIDVDQLLAHPPAVVRRLIRRALQIVKGDLRSLDFQHVERVMEMAHDPLGHGRAMLPDLDIFRSFEWLRIAPPRTGSRQDRDYSIPVTVPGSYPIPGGNTCIRLELSEISGGRPPEAPDWGYNTVDGDRIQGPLQLRNWRPGDLYSRPQGTAEKIKLLFQKARIPIWDRQGWPIITSGENIVWARQFGPAAPYAPTGQTRRILRVSEVENID